MKNIFLFMLLLAFIHANGQEAGTDEFKPTLRGSIMMAYSHIPMAVEGERSVSIIPAWGLDLNYHFHKRWAVGIQGDIKLQNFKIEDEKEVLLERNFPFSVALVAYYKTLKHWGFFIGPGIEFEESENLFLIKGGVEYGFEISENFEIEVGLIYENRDEVYDGFTFGVAFNKRLWSKGD